MSAQTSFPPVVLLDGGMGQELMRRQRGTPAPLWSAQVMREQPELVVDIHKDFIGAGARVITLNTYVLTRPRLARLGVLDLMEPLLQRAKDLGVQAREEAGVEGVRLAGSLPPVGGSYTPEVVPSFFECLEEYQRLVEAQDPVVDLFLPETMTTIAEGVAATEAAVASGKPCWTSFTVRDRDGTRLRSGEPLAAAAAAVQAAGASALLVNCSAPEAVTQALAVLKGFGLPFGGFANGFVSVHALKPGGTVDVLRSRPDLGPESYADHVTTWLDAGAEIVGGCCEVGPAHIAAIAQRLVQRGQPIVADPRTSLGVTG